MNKLYIVFLALLLTNNISYTPPTPSCNCLLLFWQKLRSKSTKTFSKEDFSQPLQTANDTELQSNTSKKNRKKLSLHELQNALTTITRRRYLSTWRTFKQKSPIPSQDANVTSLSLLYQERSSPSPTYEDGKNADEGFILVNHATIQRSKFNKE